MWYTDFSLDNLPYSVFILVYTIYIKSFEPLHLTLFNQFLTDECLDGFKPKSLRAGFLASKLYCLVRE